VLAASVDRVMTDATLRRRLVDAGLRRADDFSLARGRQRWAAAIEEVVAVAGRSGTGGTGSGRSANAVGTAASGEDSGTVAEARPGPGAADRAGVADGSGAGAGGADGSGGGDGAAAGAVDAR
jgi:hypothetical protein